MGIIGAALVARKALPQDLAEALRERMIDAGARVLITADGGYRKGAVVPPVLLGSIDESMKVGCQEIFGPVLCVVPFDTLDEAVARDIGLRVYKVAMSWPLEPQGARRFAEGLEEILVVEEKRQVIEYQLKEQLYNWRADVRPNVLGKFDEPEGDFSGGEWAMPNPSENWLLRAKADLTPAIVAAITNARARRRRTRSR